MRPTAGRSGRRKACLSDVSALEGEKGPVSIPTLRTRLELLIQEVIDALDELDAAQADLEPDAEGEAEPEEASAQPPTLAPDQYPAKVIPFPRRLRHVEVTV